MASGDAESRAFTTPPGGVMTDDVGAITGDVEAWIEGSKVRIRYAGAKDVYTVGSADGRDVDEIVAILKADAGPDEYGNPRATTL